MHLPDPLGHDGVHPRVDAQLVAERDPRGVVVDVAVAEGGEQTGAEVAGGEQAKGQDLLALLFGGRRRRRRITKIGMTSWDNSVIGKTFTFGIYLRIYVLDILT